MRCVSLRQLARRLGAAGVGAAVLIATTEQAAAQDPTDVAISDIAIPDIAKAMIEAAVDTGRPNEVQAVTNAAGAVFPDFADAIAAYGAARLSILSAPEPDETLEVVTETAAPTEDETADEAEDTPAEEPSRAFFALKPWEGRFSASAATASGNSENVAAGLSLNASRAVGDFTHNVTGYFDIGSSGGVTNQRRWGGAYKLDYAVSNDIYSFWRVSFDEDEFSGFDYRLFTGAGVGYFVAQTDAFTWQVEAGPGFRYSPIDDTREIEQELALYAATELDWVIREGLTFEQDAGVTRTDLTTTFESTTALNATLWGDLTAGLSFYYRFESNPPDGRVNEDTVTRATLGYEF